MNDPAMAHKLEAIYRRLAEAYGEPQLDPSDSRDPIGTLVNTILSQNTNDVNRDRAYQQLRARFPTWEEVRDAPTAELIKVIRPAGLAPTKGPRIQQALRTISEQRGALSLDFLPELPVEEARAWLLGMKGVGPKTAAIVLLFAFGLPVFPVDTHIYRVSQRLGLIPSHLSREQAHEALEALIPPAWYYPLHLNLITHGRRICHARNPRCERCILRDLCDFYTQGREPPRDGLQAGEETEQRPSP